MLAPVVPTKLAISAPKARNPVLVTGCATRSPFSEIPPLITYRLNSSTMKGTYSAGTAWLSTGRIASQPLAKT